MFFKVGAGNGLLRFDFFQGDAAFQFHDWNFRCRSPLDPVFLNVAEHGTQFFHASRILCVVDDLLSKLL